MRLYYTRSCFICMIFTHVYVSNISSHHLDAFGSAFGIIITSVTAWRFIVMKCLRSKDFHVQTAVFLFFFLTEDFWLLNSDITIWYKACHKMTVSYLAITFSRFWNGTHSNAQLLLSLSIMNSNEAFIKIFCKYSIRFGRKACWLMSYSE